MADIESSRPPTGTAGSTRGSPSTTSSTEYSHLSASESFLGYCAALTERIHIGSGIFSSTRISNHPVRLAERVAMLDHLSRRALRVRHAAVARAAARSAASTSTPTRPRRSGTRSSASSRRCGARRELLATTASRSSTPPAQHAARSPTAADAAPADVGRRRQPAAPTRRRPATGSACSGFNVGAVNEMAPLVDVLQGRHRRGRAGRRVRQRQRDDHERPRLPARTARQPARRVNMGSRYLQSLRCSATTTRSRTRRASRSGPSRSPEPTLDDIEYAHRGGLPAVRRPRRGRRAGRALRGRRLRPGRVRHAARPVAGARVRDDPARSAST